MSELSLGLELSPRIMGQAVRPLNVEVVRALTIDDLALLEAPRSNYKTESVIKRLSERHHALARLIATGAKPVEAAAIMSYEIATVYRLSVDPAFKELVEFYRSDVTREMRSTFERLSGLASDAADELQTRLEDEPEKFTNNQLLEVIKVGADRTGMGPSSSSVQVSVNLNIAEKMKQAREAARLASQPKIIEGELLPIRDAAE